MKLNEFLKLKDSRDDVTVYDSHNEAILSWHGDDDPRYNCPVTGFGIVSEFELWVAIDTTILEEH